MRPSALALIGMLVYLGLVTASSWNDSATFDEPIHIVSGYLCLSYGRYEINSFHPPLLKMIAAVPLAAAAPPFPLAALANPASRAAAAADWFWHKCYDPQAMLRVSRGSLVFFESVLVGAILFLLANRFGSVSAAGLLVLAFLSPSFVGLAGYTITDTGVTLCMLLSLLAFERLVTLGRGRDVLFLGLCLAAGLSSKHSFLLLPPCMVLVPAVWALAARLRGRAPTSRRALRIALQAALAASCAFLLVYALFAFAMRHMSGEVVRKHLQFFAFGAAEIPASLLRTAAQAPILYPAGWYLSGVSRTADMVAGGGQLLTSLRGTVYTGGKAYYFPFILMAKENVLVLCALAAVLWMCRRATLPRPVRVVAFSSLLIFAAYFSVALAGSLNIGYRHIMPAYLCFLLACSVLLGQLQPAAVAKRLLGFFLLCRLASLLLVFPHNLAYFNWLAGGVHEGYKSSVVSDADWGQDLLRLRDYVASSGARVHLYLASTADASYYLGTLLIPETEPLRPGELVAVSTTFLQIPEYMRREQWRQRVAAARAFPVRAQIGGSLVVFAVPADYQAPGLTKTSPVRPD
jgi:hypothetical protein